MNCPLYFIEDKPVKFHLLFKLCTRFACDAQTHVQQSFLKAAVILSKIFRIKEKSGRFTCALIQNKIGR